MRKTWSRYVRVVFVLLLFWGAVLRYMMLIPPFEGSDEREHLGYVTELRAGSFPDPTKSMENLAVQASAQAPLHYVLALLWSRLAPDYQWDGEMPDNPWRIYVRPVEANDNPNYTLFGPDQRPYKHNPNIGVSLLWMRFVSAFEGMLTVALAYATACLLLPRRWRLFATIVFSFNTVLVQLFALLTNDASAILFGIFCTYQVAVLLRRDITPRALIITGIVVGFGTLTKLSVLVFVPVAGLVVLLRAFVPANQTILSSIIRLKDVKIWGQVIRSGVLMTIPILLIAAPWYLYQGINYGDPLGIQPHLRMNWAHIPPRALAEAFHADGWTPLLTLWSGYAWGLVTTQGWVYAANILLLVIALIGYVRAFPRLWREQRLVIIALSIAVLGVFIAYLRWWTMFTFMNGRHLLPGYLALVILAALGISYGWNWHIGRVFRLTFAALTIFIAWVIVGNVTLVEAFQTITFPPEQTPALEGAPLQFGDAKFLGYDLEPHVLINGETITAKMCWQSLRQEERLPMPYAFALHIVADETIYAGRESYTGMGKYTNWQPGKAFCDRYDLITRQDFLPARGYKVAVSMFDPETTDSIPDDNNVGPFVGWIASPGPELPASERESAPYDFGGLYMLDYTVDTTDSGIAVNTHWGTGDWSARGVTFFIHIADSTGTLVAQIDRPLGDEIYPSFLWGDNERTFEQTYTLDVPAGEYTVYAGLYDTQSTERIAVTGGQGEVAPDGRILLGSVQR